MIFLSILLFSILVFVFLKNKNNIIKKIEIIEANEIQNPEIINKIEEYNNKIYIINNEIKNINKEILMFETDLNNLLNNYKFDEIKLKNKFENFFKQWKENYDNTFLKEKLEYNFSLAISKLSIQKDLIMQYTTQDIK